MFLIFDIFHNCRKNRNSFYKKNFHNLIDIKPQRISLDLEMRNVYVIRTSSNKFTYQSLKSKKTFKKDIVIISFKGRDCDYFGL